MIFLDFAGTHFFELISFCLLLVFPSAFASVWGRIFVKFIGVTGGDKKLLSFSFLIFFLGVHVSTSISGEGIELCFSSISL